LLAAVASPSFWIYLRLAQAAMGQPGTKIGELCMELGVSRQTLYRHMNPTGQLRPDGEKLLDRKKARLSVCRTGAIAGLISPAADRKEDFGKPLKSTFGN
jgi:hypothetical protein